MLYMKYVPAVLLQFRDLALSLHWCKRRKLKDSFRDSISGELIWFPRIFSVMQLDYKQDCPNCFPSGILLNMLIL